MGYEHSNSTDCEHLPAPHLDPVTKLLAVARQELERCSFESIIEHSDRSEATYVHVKRSKHWYGIRIACHQAVYQCSLDYQQIVVPSDSKQLRVEQAASELIAAIHDGNALVADPAEVRELIEYTRQRQANGRRFVDANGIRWRWGGRARQWLLDQPNQLDAVSPQFQPRAPISHLECSSIRHRLNLIARWSYEEIAAASE